LKYNPYEPYLRSFVKKRDDLLEHMKSLYGPLSNPANKVDQVDWDHWKNIFPEPYHGVDLMKKSLSETLERAKVDEEKRSKEVWKFDEVFPVKIQDMAEEVDTLQASFESLENTINKQLEDLVDDQKNIHLMTYEDILEKYPEWNDMIEKELIQFKMKTEEHLGIYD